MKCVVKGEQPAGMPIAILTDEKAHGLTFAAVRLNMLPGWTMGCKDYSIVLMYSYIYIF